MFSNGFDKSTRIGVLWKSQMALCMREPWIISDMEQVLSKNVYSCVPIAGKSDAWGHLMNCIYVKQRVNGFP